MSILCDVALSGHFVVYNLVLRDRRRKLCGFSSVWQAWHFAHAAKPLAGVAQMRGGFGGHLMRQAQYLVNLDDVLKGSKASFCETVVGFDLGHDDDSVWQVRHFGCLGLIFHGRRCTL